MTTETQEKQKKPGLMRKMITRTITGILMILGFIGVIYIGHTLIMAFVVVAQVFAFKEMLSVRFEGVTVGQWFLLVVSFGYLYTPKMLAYFSPLLPEEVFDMISRYYRFTVFSLYCVAFVRFILTLKRETLKKQFAHLTWSLMTILLIIGQTHLVISNISTGLFWIVVPHSLIIFMAYFCGVAFGKKFVNKPLTSLSPNKTWEGFIGAMIFTIIFAFFITIPASQSDWLICPRATIEDTAMGCIPNAVFLTQTYNVPEPLSVLLGSQVDIMPIQLHAIVFALFSSLVSPFGGFFASGIKRAYGKDDFHSFIPGHGGLIDRFDCQLIMVGFVYVYVSTFISPFTYSPDVLIQQIHTLEPAQQQYIFDTLSRALAA